jgi:ABC-type multidrug transport system fused ATPase/permease subunit
MSFLTPIFAIVATSVCSNWWLTYWSNHGTASTQTYFLIAYAAINSISVLVNLGVSLTTVYFGLQASRKVSILCYRQPLAIALSWLNQCWLNHLPFSKLFADLLAVVLYLPMSFYDTTPVGRIVNRFSKGTFNDIV